jgi:hypothetical protein
MAIAGGTLHSVALKTDGGIVAWGSNDFGQCTVLSPRVAFVAFAAIAAGGYHSVGLLGPPAGACCHSGGACTLTLEAACGDRGTWLGPGTRCIPNACAQTPVLLESWTVSSLREGLRIRWEVPLGTSGAVYRAWRDPAAGPHDLAPTPEAVPVSTAWVSPSAEGIIETLDREAPRGVAIRYFLERRGPGGTFLGPVDARWDPPALVWVAAPTPFRSVVRLIPPQAGPARAEIFDAAGRLVRTLTRAGGEAPLSWDGRDDAGHETRAGIYLVRLTGGSGATVKRLVKTP